ncbi:hypothetical protein [Lentzea sp. NPDC003310]|uniref:hypothetical protein n=1 Tax=Lentzea sp. NPDC003310 TaxID=3154447 RepID=UPI0033B5904C
MLLGEFVERVALAGVVFMIKMDGPRPSNKWTLHVSKSPQPEDYWVARSDCARLEQGLTRVRKRLPELPGDWSWLDEPIEDADAYADVFEEIGATGELFIVQYGLASKWVLFAAKGKFEGYASLDECVEDGLAKLGW